MVVEAMVGRPSPAPAYALVHALTGHEGREVKHTGDGIMPSFTADAAAVACATLRALADFNRSSREQIQAALRDGPAEPPARCPANPVHIDAGQPRAAVANEDLAALDVPGSEKGVRGARSYL